MTGDLRQLVRTWDQSMSGRYIEGKGWYSLAPGEKLGDHEKVENQPLQWLDLAQRLRGIATAAHRMAEWADQQRDLAEKRAADR